RATRRQAGIRRGRTSGVFRARWCWRRATCIRRTPRLVLEAVLVDVALREHQPPAEDYHRAAAVTGYRGLLPRALAEAPGDVRLARLACQLAGEEVEYDVLRQVPEVALVPEPGLLEAARLHARPHLVRQAETRPADAAALSRLRDDAGGSGD